MNDSAKVTISLPKDVLHAVERARKATKESRSEFFRRAAAERILRAEKRDAIARYVDGYRQFPETDEEVAAAHATGVAALAQDPWE